MQNLPTDQYTKELLTRIGYTDAVIEADFEGRKGVVSITELGFERKHLQDVVEALNHVVARYAEKAGQQVAFFDINGYRAEREELIQKIAQAAANKVNKSGESVELPPMNSYERMVVHGVVGEIEGVRSQSAGLGKERHVVLHRQDNPEI